MIVIFGVDGLEYDYVIDWNLQHLLQKQHGKLEVPINELRGTPYSPEVWSTFLTGQLEKREFDRPFWIKHSLHFLSWLKKFIPVSLGMGRILSKRGYTRFPIKLQQPSFLEKYNTKYLNAPFYNFDNETFKLIKKWEKNQISYQELNSTLAYLLYRREIFFIEETKENNPELEAIFTYIHVIDTLQHISINKESLHEHYNDLNRFFKRFVENFKPLDTILVISDHGYDQEKKGHSDKAFFSCNQRFIPPPIHIKDFYTLWNKLID